MKTTKQFATALVALALAIPAVHAFDDDEDEGKSNSSYAVGLWGDLPYDAAGSTVQAVGV